MSDADLEPQSPTYRMFGIHVAMLAKTICAIGIGVTAGLFIIALVFAHKVGPAILIAFPFLAFAALFYALPIYGINQRRPGFLIPYLACQGIELILVVAGIVIFTAVAIVMNFEERYDPHLYQLRSTVQLNFLYFLVCFGAIIYIPLIIWCTVIFHRCYQYLKEYQAAIRLGPSRTPFRLSSLDEGNIMLIPKPF